MARAAAAAAAGSTPDKVGSHPLRRVSSVSWAEELESIRELESIWADKAEAWGRGDVSPHTPTSPDNGADGGSTGTASFLAAAALRRQQAVLPLLAAVLLLVALMQQLLVLVG